MSKDVNMGNDEILALIESVNTTMKEGFARLEKKIDSMENESIANGKAIERIQTKLDNIDDSVKRNFLQHENDFYPKLDKLESFRDNLQGKITIIGIGWLALQAVIVGLLVAYVRSKIGG
jgi:hypothetical protein